MQFESLNYKRRRDIDEVLVTSQMILDEVMKYQRVTSKTVMCKSSTHCFKCSEPHLNKIMRFVEKRRVIKFVLPAFPGKSPNKNKVLSSSPDYAEALALGFLSRLCKKIKSIYAPGAEIIICSDGRVFSDVVGMNENDVTLYKHKLKRMIHEICPHSLSTFNLEDTYKDLSFDQMRDELMKTYGQSLEFLKHKVKRGAFSESLQEEKEANLMFRGITRFMFEDSLHAGQTKSRTSLQKEAKKKAYEVIRRSNAWSAHVEEIFPECIRLSIHPQACGSKKLGIRLIAEESWMTPWHGVALVTPKGVRLVKKHEAEALGARLVKSEKGEGSHYELNDLGEVVYAL